MNAAEYLARVGFDAVLTKWGGQEGVFEVESLADGGEPMGEANRALIEHEFVRSVLAGSDAMHRPRPLGDSDGASWLGFTITWPNRVPDLKPWAGRSTLPQIITQRRASLKKMPDDVRMRVSLYEWSVFPDRKPAKKAKVPAGADAEPGEDLREGEGHSGIDSLCCPNALDAGFSPAALDMPVAYRPALELLAIIGMEFVPLVSFGARECGFVHDGRVWRFAVEPRDGGYRYRWGALKEHPLI